MARWIYHEASRPHILEVGGEKKAICMCGLSKNYPLCDGSHHQCREEEEGVLHKYKQGKKVEED
jgi:CDGSH-type Zn-finger protein